MKESDRLEDVCVDWNMILELFPMKWLGGSRIGTIGGLL
jgi:hypothetical protein